MSAPDIPHHIAGLIAAVEGIAEAYDPIKDLRGLSESFQEVNKLLPLMDQTLRDAKCPAKKLKFSNEAKALETVLRLQQLWQSVVHQVMSYSSRS